ncbi:MAG: caspase family protein [Marinagarivorans sp.]|nr:caspase family protein [Marinagarivorans sp.]
MLTLRLNTLITSLSACTLAIGLSACGGANIKNEKTTATEGATNKEDLYIVDCKLPGQLMRLGNMQYLAPRRATKTTAVDCRIRGGEYVEYDRADYRSALGVWLPPAQEGNAEAQNYVGEIYEKGIGGNPDYTQAAAWYKKAAEQGYSRAQLNLGYFYEKGLGVDANPTLALNYYRQASGISGDNLVLSSDAKAELDETQNRLTKALAQANLQTSLLQKQMVMLKAEQANQPDAEQLAALAELQNKTVTEKKALEAELDSLRLVYRGFEKTETAPTVSQLNAADDRTLKDINFGRYYALIIGNQDYLFLDDLRSPIIDAKRLQGVLESQYGFTTLLLQDASEKAILNTINNFYDQITEHDNLLIFYAGHGEKSSVGLSQKERGYWLPIDAKDQNISSWINNAVISDHLDRIKARSILVLADSCYAGGLGAEQSALLFGVGSGTLNEQAIKSGLNKRARVVISSGGDKPVLDGTANNHSIFTRALINALENNKGLLKDSDLFSRLAINVGDTSEQLKLPQKPEMRPIREAGHEGGTFYFLPTKTL